jgi:purine-nucleoside/S-methyl-5'-thioadenosine phosphorylase / adenosine deaminase
VAVVLERRTLPEGPTALVSTALEDAGFLAAFTERTGGVSDGPFRSLNLGLATDDSPDHVFDNRRRVATGFGLDQVAALRQVHGSTVVRVEAGPLWQGFDGRRREVPRGDVLSTASADLGLVVLTADCVPVVMGDPVTGLLTVVHAGWRGVAAGVLAEAVATFPEPGRVHAAVGPAIGPDHYEVGEEVVAAVASASEGGAITGRQTSRPYLDLPGTAAQILGELGIRHIERSEDCTACLPDRFFSHRRDGPTGRQALIAARLA